MSGFIGLPDWIAYPLGAAYVLMRPWSWPKLIRQYRRSRRYRSQPCRKCSHANTVGGDWFCYRSLGLGYGHEVSPDGHCEHWKPRKD